MFYLPYISVLIAIKSIYSLCSYQHKKPIKYVSLEISIFLFKLLFIFNDMSNAANETQLSKAESASSVRVLS